MSFWKKLKEKFKRKEKYYQLKSINFNLVENISFLRKKHKTIDKSYFLELEKILISADVSPKTIKIIIERTWNQIQKNKIKEIKIANDILFDQIFKIYYNKEINITEQEKIKIKENDLTIIMIIGVNGSGKTSTIAKLAYFIKNEYQKKILLIAADTFRAAASEQLFLLSEKINVDCFQGDSNLKDPASIVYKGINKAFKENYDIVIIDTSGRMDNNQNLLKELEKINNVTNKLLSKIKRKEIKQGIDEILLIVDSTTGQNALLQAKNFSNFLDVTGIILTKIDGFLTNKVTKAGIILSIKQELNLFIKFWTYGEKIDDVDIFNFKEYLNGLMNKLKERENEN
jgi:fused signal recognition particle receptor